MKGKIDKYGNLYIERAGKMKDQLCSYASECGSPIPCSDTCPLFGEPYKKFEYSYNGKDTTTERIKLCHRELVFEELIDERVES